MLGKLKLNYVYICMAKHKISLHIHSRSLFFIPNVNHTGLKVHFISSVIIGYFNLEISYTTKAVILIRLYFTTTFC